MDDVDSINQEYQSYLQSFDYKTKFIILALLAYIKENGLAGGNYTYTKQTLLNRGIYDFKKNYIELLTNGADMAIQYSKDLKKAELAPYIDEIEKRLSQQDVSMVEAATILRMLEYSQISPVFNGSKDTDIVNRIWYKSWPDGLTVTDRANRLSNKTGLYIEQAIKHGIVVGESPKEIEKKINDHFINGSEQKAMLRLATHTVNMVYETAAAEIANDAPMIKGIRLMRSPAGSAKCQICVEHAGEVGGSGVEYLKENGDSLDVLADMPPYHAYCMCDVELIIENATDFIQKEQEKLTNRSEKDYTVSSVDTLIQNMRNRPNVTAEYAKGDTLEYLKWVGAEASHMMDIDKKSSFLFREDVTTRKTVFHEWLHRYLQLCNDGNYRPNEDQIIEEFLDRFKKTLKL